MSESKIIIPVEPPEIISEQGGLALYRYPGGAPFFMPWIFNGRAGADWCGSETIANDVLPLKENHDQKIENAS